MPNNHDNSELVKRLINMIKNMIKNDYSALMVNHSHSTPEYIRDMNKSVNFTTCVHA